MTYLKITNLEENHNELQYHDGLVEDIVPFSEEGSCCPGGIYFTTPEFILEYLNYGVSVREVTIPEDAQMVKDPQGDKWRASAVVFGPKKNLSEVATWEWLVSLGVDIHAENNRAVRWASEYGHLEVVKYLVSVGADIHAGNDLAVRWASSNGHLEVVKYLVSVGADIHADDDDALRWASNNGHLEVVKYLVSVGADIHACNDEAVRCASSNGHLKVVKYIKSLD